MYIFIVNPKAGHGRAKRVFTKITKSDLYQELDSKHYYTQYKGHAEEIVQTIIRKDKHIKSVIVIGGDGTLHEVVNGFDHHYIPISFIPGGSGNDFARGCSIKGDPVDILKSIIEQTEPRNYWLGEYTTNHQKLRYFINCMGVGFDAEIAQVANESSYKKIFNFFRLGKLTYLLALIQVLIHFQPLDVEVIVDGRKRVITNCWMITITNHPFYGGGMKIIPSSVIEPRQFPVLIVHSISKWKVFGLFMTVFSGKHLHFKEVELIKTTHLQINSPRQFFYHVDGEVNKCQTCVVKKQSKAIDVQGIYNKSLERLSK